VKLHPTKTMLALEWRGAEKVEVTPRIARAVTDPGDALIRVTSNTICGSDLHMYKNQVGEEQDATVAI
jgi:threonine dehydrogenase-like Zn-dependent dehydrogenase